jgi:hypothetical protein
MHEALNSYALEFIFGAWMLILSIVANRRYKLIATIFCLKGIKWMNDNYHRSHCQTGRELMLVTHLLSMEGTNRNSLSNISKARKFSFLLFYFLFSKNALDRISMSTQE